MAAKQGKSLQDVMNMPEDDKRAFMSAAQATAIQAYNAGNYPDLSRMKKPPNYVVPAPAPMQKMQDSYKGANGKPDVPAADIFAIAAENKISTADVIKKMRETGIIE
jgi:hypothetical protein